MSPGGQHPQRKGSFDGSLPPARFLALESEFYHLQRLQDAAPDGSRSRLPRPIDNRHFLSPTSYELITSNPVPPSYASRPYTSSQVPSNYYAPSRQQDIASQPGPEYLKYMRLFESPKTLIPNCKECLYNTDEYRFLHTPPPPRKFPEEDKSTLVWSSTIPPHAEHVITFKSNNSRLPGISMTDLLYQNNLNPEHEEKIFPHFKQYPVVPFVFNAVGYEGAVINIRTVCSHGAITEMGLAYAVARFYNLGLQCGKRKSQNMVPGHVYSGPRDHRLTSLFAVKPKHRDTQGETHMWFATVSIYGP